VLAGLLSGRQPQIGLEGLSMDRYGRPNQPMFVPQGVSA
jgi:D-amino-acid dehydrogenase